MRFLTIAIAAAFLSLPAAAPASAGSAGAHTAKAAATDFSAKRKKHRRHHAMKKPKEKVEYMRAVPSEPPK
jgi:hypothetical protein